MLNSSVRAKLLASVMIAALAAACSSDASRFSENPFANPFQSRTSFDPVTTSSVNGPRAAQQVQRPLANIRNSTVTTQPLPAPSAGMLSGAQRVPTSTAAAGAAVATTGAVASANYPRLAPVAPAAPSVIGATNGWTAVGGTPVVMQQGENINTLSSRYGVPASAIMAVNGLSGANQAQPGQQLVIPAYNAVQASGQRVAAPQPVARVASAAPMQALPAAPTRAPLMQPPPARAAAPVAAAPTVATPVRTIQPKAETEAEKRAAAKLAALRAKPAPRDDEDETPAKPVRKTDAQIKAEKAQADAKAKADAAKKLADAKKIADAKKADEAKKLAEAKAKADAERKAEAAKKAAATAVIRRPDPETTASIPVEPKAAPKPEPKAEKPAVTAPPAEESSSAAFRWPAQGRVIAGYGARGTGGANDGINIALPEGSPVRAAEGGTVVHADDALKGFGKLVLVRHSDGFVTVYAHNGDLKVKRGESVKRGQVIATSGQSGNVTSPQLHFQIRKGATPVDPMKYLASN